MTTEENSNIARKLAAKGGFTDGETFAEYIMRKYELKQGDRTDSLPDQILKNTQFCELLGYLKWKNRAPPDFSKRHLLAPLLQNMLLPSSVSTYDYIARSREQEREETGSVQKLEFVPQHQSIIRRRTCIYVARPEDSDGLIGMLNDFIVYCVVDHLEEQILNGKGAGHPNDRELAGMLGQGYPCNGKGNLLEICMKSAEKFHKKTGRAPTAMVMSFAQKLHLMKILSERTPGILATTWASFYSHLGAIPILLSDFMPENKIMLANLDSVYLISKEGDNRFNTYLYLDRIDFAYNYWCNIVVKEAGAVMTVTLPDDCLTNIAKS